MSNYYINIRVGLYHIQLDHKCKFGVIKNVYHKGYEFGFIEVYNFFWYNKEYS